MPTQHVPMLQVQHIPMLVPTLFASMVLKLGVCIHVSMCHVDATVSAHLSWRVCALSSRPAWVAGCSAVLHRWGPLAACQQGPNRHASPPPAETQTVHGFFCLPRSLRLHAQLQQLPLTVDMLHWWAHDLCWRSRQCYPAKPTWSTRAISKRSSYHSGGPSGRLQTDSSSCDVTKLMLHNIACPMSHDVYPSAACLGSDRQSVHV